MALVICDAGELRLLDLMLKTALDVDETFTLHLFKNDITPDASSAVGDFTEADFTGYSSVSLLRATWTSAVTDTGVATTQYGNSPLSWSCTGSGNTVYGAYVLDGNGDLVWAEKFSTARTLVNGDVLNYTVVFTLNSAN